MIKKFSTPFLAFLQATGLVVYMILLSLFFSCAKYVFSKPDAEFFAPIIMLLLFIISAVITATMVLGRAGMLFWEKKYAESFKLIIWTVGWGIFYFIIIITFLYLK